MRNSIFWNSLWTRTGIRLIKNLSLRLCFVVPRQPVYRTTQVSMHTFRSLYLCTYIHLEDNRPRVRVVCRHAYACRYSHSHIQSHIHVFEVYIHMCETYVTEGSDCVVAFASLGTHISVRICVYVCVWNSWCTRLHRGIAQPKGEHSRRSSRRAIQAPCYDFQNGEAQWPRSAPDKIVIIIVLAMAGIEERYTHELVRVYLYI